MADEGHQGGCEVGQGDGKEEQLDQLEVMRLVPVAHRLHHLPVQLIPWKNCHTVVRHSFTKRKWYILLHVDHLAVLAHGELLKNSLR